MSNEQEANMVNSAGSSEFSLVPASAVTRVMSPRTFDVNVHQVALLDVEKECMVCGDMCFAGQHVICAKCGLHGHPQCIRVQMITVTHGHIPFCLNCYPDAHEEFRRFQDQLQRNRWADSVRASLFTWKCRVQGALEVGTSLGTTAGGVVAAVTATAVGTATGFVQAVTEGASAGL